MFNWFGNQKIGILGSANSGKTILLTSLLWHLSNHDPNRFNLANNAKISNFKQNKLKKNDFQFNLYKNTFTQNHRWPDKTADFSIADCKYIRQDRFCERHIKFVDIPGERVSDVLLWKAGNYAEWVKSLHNFWLENPAVNDIMKEYWNKANNSSATLEDLNIAYKTAMWKMLKSYCPITPSTYYLGTDGQQLGDEKNNDEQQAINERAIWDGGELLPVPENWKKERPDEYKTFVTNFKLYKKQVLKPLFNEINDCDNFIFCVDILNILMSGPTLFLQTQREFKDFVEHLAPGKFSRLLDRVGNNPPRLAFVATKADMVSSSNKDKFDALLKDFSEPVASAAGIKYRRFICSACVSTREKNGQLIGGDCDRWGAYIDLTIDLPESWPDHWEGEDYQMDEVAPDVSVALPPKQINLDKLFDFIVEGVEGI